MEPVIPPQPTPVLPPGPFPPQGHEPRGTVDLGIRLRDLLYHRSFVTQTARQALASSVSRMAQAPELLYRSQRAVELLIDTWPLGALVDDARERWTRGPDARSLAVLERAAELAATTLGWPTTIDRRWPLPDEQAIRDLAGPGPHVAIRRGDGDGAPAVAVALQAPLGGRRAVALPPVLDVHGDELVDRCDALVAALEAGEGVAVRALTPVPWDDGSQEALARIRAVAPAQRAYERYGQAGLLVGEVVAFEDLLTDAPSGTVGARVRRTGSVLVLPNLTPEGHIQAVGVLVWNAAYRPVPVAPGVAAILSQLDAARTPSELARAVGVGAADLEPILHELADVGAIDAA